MTTCVEYSSPEKSSKFNTLDLHGEGNHTFTGVGGWVGAPQVVR